MTKHNTKPEREKFRQPARLIDVAYCSVAIILVLTPDPLVRYVSFMLVIILSFFL